MLHLAFKGMTTEDIYDALVFCFLKAARRYDLHYADQTETAYEEISGLPNRKFNREQLELEEGFRRTGILERLVREGYLAGEDFYAAITAALVPVDMRAPRALKRSPLARDLYVCLVHTAFSASRKHESENAWRALGTLSPERLRTLCHVATIESIDSSIIIEGTSSEREVERLLSNLGIGSVASRDEQDRVFQAFAVQPHLTRNFKTWLRGRSDPRLHSPGDHPVRRTRHRIRHCLTEFEPRHRHKEFLQFFKRIHQAGTGRP